MTIVLPHGVLFRGGEEGNIRKNLLENRHIEAIIGLPANIFFGTGIPTIIMVLRQKREDSDVLIVDASKGFEKVGKNNRLRASDIKRIVDAVKKAANLVGIKKIIPSGTAIQNARTSFIGDHMNRDGYHLDLTIGRYTAACTWFEALTHQNVTENPYSPEGMDPIHKKAAQMAAHNAILYPDKVTELTELKKIAD